MKLNDLLVLSPEDKKKRRDEWKEKQRLKKEGKDAERIIAQERAHKALILLKKHVDGTRICSESERVVLSGIVLERCIDSFYFFCRYVLEMDLLTDQTHKRWCDDLSKAYKSGRKRLMRLKSRGSYKTSVYGIANILYLWGCYSPQIRIFYTSANALLLQEVSDKLNQYIGSEKNETLYSTIFGITKDAVAKNTSDVINIKGRSGKGFSLILRTSGGSSVGIHPNVILVDDPLDQNDRDSQTTRDGKESWFDSLTPLLVPFHDNKTGITFETILYVGTTWHFRDLIWHILERDKSLPESQKWDVEREAICDESGKSNYPDFISDQKIAEIRAGISDVFFACQYLCNPLPENLQIFNLKKMTFVRKDQIDLNQGEILCALDPSLGKTSSDYAAVWWVHSFNNDLTFFDAIDTKVELSLIVHQIAAKNKEYNCRSMLYENNGMTLIDESIRGAHDRINWKMSYESIHHSSNKRERIISCQPDLYSGSVRFMDDYLVRYPEAINQITFYGAYNHDDFPDCMEMAISFFRRKRFKFIRYEELS